MLQHKSNLTQYEHDALAGVFNLADGHAHHNPDQHQAQIVAQLEDVFHYAQRTPHSIIQRSFLSSLFDFAGQKHALSVLDNCMPCYSASAAIEITAHLLKKRKLRTALIEPTFDNLHSILKRVGVETVAIDESVILPEPNFEALSNLGVDALFLVLPNNPTGLFLAKTSFFNIVEFCARNGVVLVVDFSFRFFIDSMYLWDQYASALDAGIDFAFIEDTGKTWPALDLKTGILTVSSTLFEEAFTIHNDVLLNVSPFILELLRRYLADSQTRGHASSINEVVEYNRDYLRSSLTGLFLQPTNIDTTLSVEWLLITNEWTAGQLCSTLSSRGVHVLPGTHFFWNDWARGEKFIRVALMRCPDMFKEAINTIVLALPVG